MRFKRKIPVTVVLAAMVWICAAATADPNDAKDPKYPKDPERPYSNLKVLPKDIASKDLQRIMIDEFEDGLGVSCNFCHARGKDSVHLDFASDAKPEKEIARSMMRMTLAINKKFFKIKHPVIGDASLAATCNTCHRGVAFPADF
jgi:cytochrome c553